jgi:hypothetical protein
MEMQAIGPPATRRDMVPDTFFFTTPLFSPAGLLSWPRRHCIGSKKHLRWPIC